MKQLGRLEIIKLTIHHPVCRSHRIGNQCHGGWIGHPNSSRPWGLWIVVPGLGLRHDPCRWQSSNSHSATAAYWAHIWAASEIAPELAGRRHGPWHWDDRSLHKIYLTADIEEHLLVLYSLRSLLIWNMVVGRRGTEYPKCNCSL